MADLGSSTTLAANFNLVRLYPQGWKSGSFRNDEDRSIYYAKAAAHGQKVGAVVFTTGYGDSINFHYDAIRNWQDRGFEVYAMDWVGQGLSDREDPSTVHDPNDRLMTRHMLDLHKFVTDIVPKSETQPLYLASHSMGGHVSMMYLKHFPNTFDRAILGAPMLDLNTSFLPRPAFKGLVNVANALGLGDDPLPNWRNLLNRVSEASDNIRNLSSHPEQLTLSQQASERIRVLFKPVEISLPSWLWVKRTYSSLDDMRGKDYFADIKTPVLMFAAGRDELVSNDAIHFAAKQLQKGQVKDLPTAEHGVWNSSRQNHDELWSTIDGFIAPDIGKAAPARNHLVTPDQILPGRAHIAAANQPRALAFG